MLRVLPVLKVKINQYAEAELTTVSVVNAKAVLPREMLLIMVLTCTK